MSSHIAPRHRAARLRPLPRVAVAAVAVAVAVVLVMGGPGSLAFWRASSTVPGGTIATGALGLAPLTGNGLTNGCSAWTFTRTGSTASGTPTTTAYTGQVLQPHDVLTQSCSYVLTAKGTHIKGTIAYTAASGYATPATGVGLAAAMTLGTTAGTNGQVAFTGANNGNTLTLTLTLTVSDTETDGLNTTPPMGASVPTSAFTITATQGRP